METVKKFEIFSGTGGVGKTTMATSRAIQLAQEGRKILLITIDPAKRLKDLLQLKDEEAGQTVNVKNPMGIGDELSIDAQLMNPSATLQKIAEITKSQSVLNSRILKILSKPYGGLNEILAIVELQLNTEKNIYDTIVLDTPPGSHFLDFLESSQKIKAFFDQNFIDIFNALGKGNKSRGMKAGKRFMTMMVSGGVKKLLTYLQKVTGSEFINDFMDAIGAIYETKDTFLSALKLQSKLQDPAFANWFLVTSVDQSKVKEALDLSSNASKIFGDKSFIILNKCLSHKLELWEPESEDILSIKLKESFNIKENKLKTIINEKFNRVLEFPEILKLSPTEQVIDLAKRWSELQSGLSKT